MKICKILCNSLHKTQKKLTNIVIYTFLLFDLNINAKKNPNKMTDESPAETADNPPLIAPKMPSSFAPSSAPFARLLPKPMMGTVTPAPANSSIYLNAPVISRRTPRSKNVTRIRADDILVLLIRI